MRCDLSSLVDTRLWDLVEETRAFYAHRRTGRGPGNIEELHRMRAAAVVEPDPAVAVEMLTIDGRSVETWTYLPAGAPRGVVLDLHGGGFYLGPTAGSDRRSRRLADALGVAVVSVDYRLAPEHPWPAAPDDCHTAALWLVAHAESRFGTSQVAVAGFSAGATLAMTTLLRLRDQGVRGVVGGVLEFGTFDLSGRTPAGRLIADVYFIDAYAGVVADRTHPDVSPLFADLAGLPPVLIVVGTGDVLLDDNLAMAMRLSAAGNEVELAVHPEAPHGFTGHPTPMARAAQATIDTWLGQRMGAGH